VRISSSSAAAMSTNWPHGEPGICSDGRGSSGSASSCTCVVRGEYSGETGAEIVTAADDEETESASANRASSTSDSVDFRRVKLDFFRRGFARSTQGIGNGGDTRSETSGKLSSKETFRGAARNEADRAGGGTICVRLQRFETFGMIC
jgi:hypothetical protein